MNRIKVDHPSRSLLEINPEADCFHPDFDNS